MHTSDDMYSNRPKPTYPPSAIDAQDMVQLLHDVISIDDSRASHERPMETTSIASRNDYARALASAAHTLPYNNWSHQRHVQDGTHSKHIDQVYPAVPKQLKYEQQPPPFCAHNGSFDFHPNQQYDNHSLDMYIQGDEPHRLQHPPVEDIGVRSTVTVTPHSSHAMTSPVAANTSTVAGFTSSGGHSTLSPNKSQLPSESAPFYNDSSSSDVMMQSTGYEYERHPPHVYSPVHKQVRSDNSEI